MRRTYLRILQNKPALRLLPALAAALILASGWAVGQQQGPPAPHPRLLLVTPPGGKAGTTVEIALTGQDLDEPQALAFSKPGIKAELVETPPPPPPDPKKQPPPKKKKGGMGGPTGTYRFKVTIPADTPPGIHDVRALSRRGLSNARAFVVGDQIEVLEKEPNNDVDQAQRVEINSTINGAITAPTDVDYFAFAGKKGQRVVVSCLASSIDSRLPAALQLYGPGGSLLASNRDYHGSDAVLDATLPDDGDYQVRVFAFTYTQGSAEHFYRLTISTAPWIDAVFPPVVEPGKPATLTVYGRNLPGGKPDPAARIDSRELDKLIVTVNVPNEPAAQHRLAYSGHVPPRASRLDGFEYRLRNGSGWSNPYLLTFAQAPVVLDNGANDAPDKAQEVTLPCEIAGRFEKRGDRDWYRFTAKKGDVYSIEMFADRLGSPFTPFFSLRSEDGKKTIAESADNNDTLHPTQFLTRTEDPQRYRFTVPADGTYLLRVGSREGDLQAGPRHLYAVRIAPERPDFRLIVMPPAPNLPDSCVLNAGANLYYTVFVWRQDGFTGDVTLTAEGLPKGVTCSPQRVGDNQKQGTLVLTAAADAPPWAGTITVKGTATINGEKVEREARPASVTWPVPQQNVITVARLDRNLALSVREKALYSLTAGLDHKDVTPGTKVTVPLKLARLAKDFKAAVQVTALNLPQPNNLIVFNNNQPLTVAAGKDEANVTLDVRQNVPPGTYTIVFRGQAIVQVPRDKEGKQKVNAAVVQVSTPVTLTVLPKEVAKVALAPGNPTVKIGQEVELTVKVSRLNNYRGDFKVQLVLPKGVKGLTASEATIPAGKDEAKLVLKAEPGASPGNRNGLLVRVTALVNGKTPVTQEAKLNVNVTK